MTTIESSHTDGVPAASVPAEPAATAAAPAPAFPLVTTTLLVAIGLIFLGELQFGVQEQSGALHPGIVTLLAFGALQYPLVVDQGQWYRLLSAPLLHLDIMHIIFNAVVLYFAGRSLEAMIGRLWFAAVFIVGGIGGGLMSLAVNAHTLVSVGASGAIMAVLAAMFVLSFHFEGTERRSLQTGSLRFLIPSLIPLGTSHGGSVVDYGAHFGGTLAGAAMAAILLVVWRERDATPSLRRIAAGIVALGLLATGYSAVANARAYPAYNLNRFLIPAAKIPSDGEARVASAPDLIRQYPRDPRGRFFEAVALVRAKDLAGAEAQMKIGLAEDDILRMLIEPTFKIHMQSYLALIQYDLQHKDDAMESARAGCLSTTASLHPNLVKLGLCGPEKS